MPQQILEVYSGAFKQPERKKYKLFVHNGSFKKKY